MNKLNWKFNRVLLFLAAHYKDVTLMRLWLIHLCFSLGKVPGTSVEISETVAM